VGPSYVVVSAIVIAVVCGTWLARVAAALDFAVLVLGGHIFSGLSHLDVSAVGHLTAMVTAAAGVTLILARHGRPVAVVIRRRRTADRAVALEAGADEPSSP
jgi:hypothetical protein